MLVRISIIIVVYFGKGNVKGNSLQFALKILSIDIDLSLVSLKTLISKCHIVTNAVR